MKGRRVEVRGRAAGGCSGLPVGRPRRLAPSLRTATSPNYYFRRRFLTFCSPCFDGGQFSYYKEFSGGRNKSILQVHFFKFFFEIGLEKNFLFSCGFQSHSLKGRGNNLRILTGNVNKVFFARTQKKGDA